MAKPSEKSVAMEVGLMSMFGFDRRKSIEADLCVPAPMGCGKPVGEFRDELSRKDYSIIGMCQSCQDSFYMESEEE